MWVVVIIKVGPSHLCQGTSKGYGGERRWPSRAGERMSPESSKKKRREISDKQQKAIDEAADNMVKSAELSKAKMMVPLGNDGILYQTDDRFFHHSVHTEKSLKDKIKRGE